MINSKKVIERFESNPEASFSNDKSLMPIAETIRDWFNQTESELKTAEWILTHQTLNDYEKVAGLFFLGCFVTSHMFAAIQTTGSMEEFVSKMTEWISND